MLLLRHEEVLRGWYDVRIDRTHYIPTANIWGKVPKAKFGREKNSGKEQHSGGHAFVSNISTSCTVSMSGMVSNLEQRIDEDQFFSVPP